MHDQCQLLAPPSGKFRTYKSLSNRRRDRALPKKYLIRPPRRGLLTTKVCRNDEALSSECKQMDATGCFRPKDRRNGQFRVQTDPRIRPIEAVSQR